MENAPKITTKDVMDVNAKSLKEATTKLASKYGITEKEAEQHLINLSEKRGRDFYPNEEREEADHATPAELREEKHNSGEQMS